MEPIDLNASNSSTIHKSEEDYNALARASLVLGILSLIPIFYVIVSPIFGLLAIIFGIIGKKDGNEDDKKQATAGIVCGVIGIIISILIVVLILKLIAAFFNAVGGIAGAISNLTDVPSLIEKYQSGDIEGIIETFRNLDFSRLTPST